MHYHSKLSKITFYILFGWWLLFLPNSPYIITDLVHLQNENSNLLWLDLFLVFVFAINGMVLGILSLLDIYTILTSKFSSIVANCILLKVCLLSGFGVYLGRFLRFNSWDILSKPKLLFLEILNSVSEKNTWLITFAFGGFFWILFLLFKSVNSSKGSIG